MFYIEQTSQPARQASVWLCGQAYLEPLPVGLHLEDDARVRLRQSISVGNAFARHTQLDLGQAGAVKDPQRVGSRLVNVAHLLHSVLENKKGEENDAPVTAIFFKGKKRPRAHPHTGNCSARRCECLKSLLSHLSKRLAISVK